MLDSVIELGNDIVLGIFFGEQALVDGALDCLFNNGLRRRWLRSIRSLTNFELQRPLILWLADHVGREVGHDGSSVEAGAGLAWEI